MDLTEDNTLKYYRLTYLCFYLQQLSIVPGFTAKGVKVAANQEQHHNNDHQEPGEDEAEAGAPESTVEVKRWWKCNGMEWCKVKWVLCICPPPPLPHADFHPGIRVRVKEWSCSTHIMKKTPPQSAVQERLVGSSCAFRPMGPSKRPRKLHTTTRRTTKHTAKQTLHLREDIYRHFRHAAHLTASEGAASEAPHLILSIFLTSGVYVLMWPCTVWMFFDTSVRASRGISLVTEEIWSLMSFKNTLLSVTHTHTQFLFKMNPRHNCCGCTCKTLTCDDSSGLLRNLGGDVVVERLHLTTKQTAVSRWCFCEWLCDLSAPVSSLCSNRWQHCVFEVLLLA